MEATDFLVDVGSPAALDDTLRALPGVNAFVIGGPDGPFAEDDGHYVVRVFGGAMQASMFKFMVESQGYCTIIRQRDETSPRCAICGDKGVVEISAGFDPPEPDWTECECQETGE